MKHIKKYKIFESSFEIDDKGVINSIEDLLLPVNDKELYTSVSYKRYEGVGLAKRKDNWKAMPGTYISVYIAKDKHQDIVFKFTDTIYETYLDIHEYIEYKFGVTEDGYNIEYYFETASSNEDIPHYWDATSDYVWPKGEPIEDSFYSIDEFKDFADKYDMEFAYLSISYKLK